LTVSDTFEIVAEATQKIVGTASYVLSRHGGEKAYKPMVQKPNGETVVIDKPFKTATAAIEFAKTIAVTHLPEVAENDGHSVRVADSSALEAENV
jgi:hypothetical protein